MKLLGSNKRKVTNSKSGKNVPHLEICFSSLQYCQQWFS